MNYVLRVLLILSFLANPLYAGGHRKVVKEVYNTEVVHSQKIIEFNKFNTLKVIAVPVTSYGPAYHYESLGLRRNAASKPLSQEDMDYIITGVVQGIKDQILVVEEPEPEDPASPEQPQTPPVGEQPSDLKSQVVGIFNNRCIQCHDSTTNKGNLTLLLEDGQINPDLTDRQVSKITRRTRGGNGLDLKQRMPLNADALSDEEIDILQRWEDAKFNE